MVTPFSCQCKRRTTHWPRLGVQNKAHVEFCILFLFVSNKNIIYTHGGMMCLMTVSVFYFMWSTLQEWVLVLERVERPVVLMKSLSHNPKIKKRSTNIAFPKTWSRPHSVTAGVELNEIVILWNVNWNFSSIMSKFRKIKVWHNACKPLIGCVPLVDNHRSRLSGLTAVVPQRGQCTPSHTKEWNRHGHVSMHIICGLVCV